jgi:hypothetical protein
VAGPNPTPGAINIVQMNPVVGLLWLPEDLCVLEIADVLESGFDQFAGFVDCPCDFRDVVLVI